MARKIKKDNSTEFRHSNAYLRTLRWVTDVYLILLICIYPFMVKRGYSSTSHVKYQFLTAISYYINFGVIAIPALIPIVILLFTAGTVKYLHDSKKSLLAFIKEIKLSIPDIFVLAYAISLILSTIVSSNKGELLWGYPTWNMGLASQVLFVMLYFIISRFFDLYELELMIYASLISSAGVFIIEILQKLDINVFGLYTGKSLSTLMLSTIGNINWFSSYNTLMLTVSAFIVWYFDRSKRLYWIAFIHLIISSASIVTQNSDSAYLGLLAMTSILFIWSFEEPERLEAWCRMMLDILITWRIVGFVRVFRGKKASSIADISRFMVHSPYMCIPIILLLLLYLYVSTKDQGKKNEAVKRMRRIPVIYIWMLISGAVILIIYIILNTNNVFPKRLTSHSTLLFFNMLWGSKRGALWHDAVVSMIREWQEEPLKVIFGAGADQFYSVVDKYESRQIKAAIRSVATNAHNEWLTAFVNFGIIGGIAYIGIFISSFFRYAMHRDETPYVIAAACCIAAYMSHNLVSFQQFVCTPYIFVVMGIGEQIIRSGYKGVDIA